MARTNDQTKIREWAADKGYEVGQRGRLSAEVQLAYKAAHRSTAKAKTSNGLAAKVRKFAMDRGIEIGQRGRVPRPLIADYLTSHAPEARQIAQQVGVEVNQRGRISREQAQALAAQFSN